MESFENIKNHVGSKLKDYESVPELDIMPSIQNELDLERDMISNITDAKISEIEKSLKEDEEQNKPRETIN